MSTKSGINSDLHQIDLDSRDKLIDSIVVQCSLVNVNDEEPPCNSDAMDTLKYCRTAPWSNQVPNAPINLGGSTSNPIKIEIDDDINIASPTKMKQLCIQVPYATSSANPIWIQDIMRAKAGTSDG